MWCGWKKCTIKDKNKWRWSRLLLGVFVLHIWGGRLTLLLNAVGFGAVSFPATVAGALANRSLPALRCGLVERARWACVLLDAGGCWRNLLPVPHPPWSPGWCCGRWGVLGGGCRVTAAACPRVIQQPARTTQLPGEGFWAPGQRWVMQPRPGGQSSKALPEPPTCATSLGLAGPRVLCAGWEGRSQRAAEHGRVWERWRPISGIIIHPPTHLLSCNSSSAQPGWPRNQESSRGFIQICCIYNGEQMRSCCLEHVASFQPFPQVFHNSCDFESKSTLYWNIIWVHLLLLPTLPLPSPPRQIFVRKW